MLGSSYFSLVQALHDCRSFEEVAELLSDQLPAQFAADHPTIVGLGNDLKILGVYGSSRNSEIVRRNLDLLQTQILKHPLVGKVDFGDLTHLGYTASDFLDAGDYRSTEYTRGLPKQMQADDSIAGVLASSWERSTILFLCRDSGTFSAEEREVFDAVLFVARAVLGKIGQEELERHFRKFLLGSSSNAPICLYSLSTGREVLPINFQALRVAEQWWGEDEAFHEISEEDYARICERMKEAWRDPVAACFRSFKLDLGGGETEFHAIPKAEGEILMICPDPGGHPMSSDEAVNALLTRRQKEIMDWIAEGKTSAEAAIILNISPRTVEKHLEAVFQRLGVENRIAAVRRFLDLKAGVPV